MCYDKTKKSKKVTNKKKAEQKRLTFIQKRKQSE